MKAKPRSRRVVAGPVKAGAVIQSDIAWSTSDSINVFGHDLVRDLIGKVNIGDVGYLEIVGRLPTTNESRMFNALLVTLAEHGIVPSTLAARLTFTGAPESLQAAIAAGLLGLGNVFVGSTEGAARMLMEALPNPKSQTTSSLRDLAERIVGERSKAKKILPGFGHPIHTVVDPRTIRLWEIAKDTGFSGPYVDLMKLIEKAAAQKLGRALPINATGAIGAICCEMKIPWQVCRGIGVMARAIGLIGHILEEQRMPMAQEVWRRVDKEASAHARNKRTRKS